MIRNRAGWRRFAKCKKVGLQILHFLMIRPLSSTPSNRRVKLEDFQSLEIQLNFQLDSYLSRESLLEMI